MAAPLVSVSTTAHCFDVQFHPSEPLLAAATISGEIELHRYDATAGAAERSLTMASHSDSCRTARFLRDNDDGDQNGAAVRLASAAADKFTVVSDVERGERVWRAKLRAAGNALLPLDRERFIVGDDDGHIRIYDIREAKSVVRYAENEDFISDMARGSDKHSICATSGDGTLAVYDIRKNGTKGLVAMSDFQEDEYLSLAIVKHGTKVVCGSQTGALAIFTWGDFGDQKDRIKGHPMSVDAMVKLTEERILTGSSDGNIRVVSVYSRDHGNRVIGFLGEHGEYPLERLALSADGSFVASASHGSPSIQIWSTDPAHKFPNEEGVEAKANEGAGGAAASDGSDSDSDAPKARRKKRRKGGAKRATAEVARKAGSFFAGL